MRQIRHYNIWFQNKALFALRASSKNVSSTDNNSIITTTLGNINQEFTETKGGNLGGRGKVLPCFGRVVLKKKKKKIVTKQNKINYFFFY